VTSNEESKVPVLGLYFASQRVLKQLRALSFAAQPDPNSSNFRKEERLSKNTANSQYEQDKYRPLAYSRFPLSSVTSFCQRKMDDQLLFGKKVRAVREAANMSRELAAEKAGITVSYLGEVERGEKWPSIEILRSIATALNAPLSTFLEFEAQEIDTAILREKLNRVLDNRTTEQQQQALRVLKALFEP
jgi:transcriptional regulator with XRE-family HTH domain